MNKTVMMDALYRVFDEKTGITTFAVLTLAAGNHVGIGVAAVSVESRNNRVRNGQTWSFITAGECGTFEGWMEKKFFPKDREKR